MAIYTFSDSWKVYYIIQFIAFIYNIYFIFLYTFQTIQLYISYMFLVSFQMHSYVIFLYQESFLMIV